MLANLSLVPVWIPLSSDLEKLRGKVVRLLLPDGGHFDAFVKMGLDEAHKERCTLILSDPEDDPRTRTYLTEDAIAMLQPSDPGQSGSDLILDFRQGGLPGGQSDGGVKD